MPNRVDTRGRRPRRSGGGPVAGSLLLPLLVGLVGCSQTATLDDDRTEARIRERLAEAYDVPISSVSCPDDVEVEDGGRFRCQATTPGGVVEVAVRQPEGDGALALEPAQAVLVTERVAADIGEVLADRFERDDVAVDCAGPEVRVEEVEATFTCEARDGDEARTVEVRVRDGWGAVGYALS